MTEAAILHQVIRHQALLHLGQTGTWAAGTPPQGMCQGSAADASDQSTKLSRSFLDWLESPGCYWSAELDWSACFLTPWFTPHQSHLFFMPKRSCCEVLLMVCCLLLLMICFQVAVLCDVYGLFLLPAAGRHLPCHWYEGLVGWTAIHIPRYCSRVQCVMWICIKTPITQLALGGTLWKGCANYLQEAVFDFFRGIICNIVHY